MSDSFRSSMILKDEEGMHRAIINFVVFFVLVVVVVVVVVVVLVLSLA